MKSLLILTLALLAKCTDDTVDSEITPDSPRPSFTRPFITQPKKFLPGVPTPQKPSTTLIPIAPILSVSSPASPRIAAPISPISVSRHSIEVGQEDDEELMFHAQPFYGEHDPLPVEYYDEPIRSPRSPRASVSTGRTVVPDNRPAVDPSVNTTASTHVTKKLPFLKSLKLWKNQQINKVDISISNSVVSTLRREFDGKKSKWIRYIVAILSVESEERYNANQLVLSVAALDAVEHWNVITDLISKLEFTNQQSFLVRAHFKKEFRAIIKRIQKTDDILWKSAYKALKNIKSRHSEKLAVNESDLVIGLTGTWDQLDKRVESFFDRVRMNLPNVQIDESKKMNFYLKSLPEFIDRSQKRTLMIKKGLEQSEYKMALIAHSESITTSWITLSNKLFPLVTEKHQYNQLDLCKPFETLWNDYLVLYRAYKSAIDAAIFSVTAKPALKGSQNVMLMNLDTLQAVFANADEGWNTCVREVRESKVGNAVSRP